MSGPVAGNGRDERIRLGLAVAAAPRDVAARRAFAAALAKAGEARAALDQYRALLALVPHDPDAAADAGLMARQCMREEEMLPVLRAAAERHPRHVRLWQVLGLTHRALEDLEPATEALRRAAALAPKDVKIAHALARAEFDAGRDSVALFRRALQLAPEDKTAVTGVVAALVAENRTADAADLLRDELRRSPDWVGGHATLARYLWAMGDRTHYTASMEEALRRNPSDIALWAELVMTLVHARDYEGGLAAVARGRAAMGEHPTFDVNEAVCHAELGNFAEADRIYEAAMPTAHSSVKLYYVRHLLRTNRPAEAERIAREESAESESFWPYLATAWRLTGDPAWEWLEGDPRLVGIYDLSGAIPSLDALADCLRALHNSVQQPLDQSLRGGTQTDGILFARVEPEIRALRKAVHEAVQAHVAQLPPRDPRHPQLRHRRAPIRFSGSWSVRLASGGKHANHIHPAGWFSSALYIALPPLEQRGPEPAGWLTLGEPPSELEIDIEPFRLVEPKPGRLVLFPSTMWHGTRPFDEGERLTVAFDVARPL